MIAMRMHLRRSMSPIVWTLATVVVLLTMSSIAVFATEDLVSSLHSELIPDEGTETPYGIPLSLSSLPEFVGWWYTLVPLVETDAVYIDALSSLVAPCCDDNLAIRCCCENDEGQACNLIRSGKGLAAHLIDTLNYGTEQVRSSVLEWFQFARPDYTIAVEMVNRKIDPMAYGLTVEGSCYRGLCNTPISQGGCGGMKELIEPAIASSSGS